MKLFFVTLSIIILPTLKSTAQENKLEFDINGICNCIENLVESNENKIDFLIGYEDCFTIAYEKVLSQDYGDSINWYVDELFGNLYNSCPYQKIADQLLNDYTSVKSRSRIEDTEKCKILRSGKFLDDSGGTEAFILMQDSIQIVTFDDDSIYTKSRIIWNDDCSYTLIFLESTNPYENSILNYGDERKVNIIDFLSEDEIIIETEVFQRFFLGRIKKL